MHSEKKDKNISENVKAEQTEHLVFQLQYFINRKYKSRALCYFVCFIYY